MIWKTIRLFFISTITVSLGMVGLAIANYAVTLGTGTNFASIVISSVHYAAMVISDPPPGQLLSAPLGNGLKVTVSSGNSAQVCVWMRPSLNTDVSGVTYNADAPTLIERANPSLGVSTDTVKATWTGYVAGTWSQQCATTDVATADGQFEFVVSADQTAASNVGGSINIADWSASGGALNPNGSQQFFFNGVPNQGVVPITSRFIGGG